MATHRINSTDSSSFAVDDFGAQVLSWRPAREEERLYLSPLSHPGLDTVLRGGVPVIWPQFNAWGPYARHGFARRMPWTYLGEDQGGGGHRTLSFTLQENEQTLAEWPFAFRLRLDVTGGWKGLRVRLEVRNPGPQPFTFSAALHTYFRVDDLDALALRGLKGATFQDWASGGDRSSQTQAEEELGFGPETDRIYFSAPREVHLAEPGRLTAISQEGFRDMVVWNPGELKGEGLEDLPDAGWRGFVCVEAAQIDPPVSLEPGERWTGAQILHALPVG